MMIGMGLNLPVGKWNVKDLEKTASIVLDISCQDMAAMRRCARLSDTI
jgi:hypothetical protein